MSDSVDRVFAHALNTVKKLPRLGTARPPAEARLQLYGLYKQSMEGDITGVMDRPSGNGEEAHAEQEKWDSWNSQKGLSRTEAKRQYITTLIDTMHRYASTTADARELVSELEFVWDQIRSNSNPASDSSSHEYRALRPSLPGRFESSYDEDEEEDNQGQTLRVLSPVSDGQIADNDDDPGEEEDILEPDNEGEEEDEEDEGYNTKPRHVAQHAGDETEDDEAQEFVDAHEDSQVAANDGPPFPSPTASISQHAHLPPSPATKRQGVVSSISAYLQQKRSLTATPATPKTQQRAQQPARQAKSPLDAAWGRRIETALIKLNTEMTALRESLDHHTAAAAAAASSSSLLPLPSFHRRPSSPASALFNHQSGYTSFSMRNVAASLARTAWRAVVAGVRHVLFDAAILAGISLVLYLRGVKMERAEEIVKGWITRVKAAILVRKLETVIAAGRGKVAHLPALPRALVYRGRDR